MDMIPKATILTVSAILALSSVPTLAGAASATTATNPATAQITAQRLYCGANAFISRRNNTQYGISGEITGCHGYLQIKCWPIHRHSFKWHTHAMRVNVGRSGRSVSGKSGWIKGTNGDTYKAKCSFYQDHHYVTSITTKSITL
jgi:hypothetical protein